MLSWLPVLFPILFINLTGGSCQEFTEILLSTNVVYPVHHQPDAILVRLSFYGFDPADVSGGD